jgi:hypothetical protein
MNPAATMPEYRRPTVHETSSLERSIVILLIKLLLKAGRTSGSARSRGPSSSLIANCESART